MDDINQAIIFGLTAVMLVFVGIVLVRNRKAQREWQTHVKLVQDVNRRTLEILERWDQNTERLAAVLERFESRLDRRSKKKIQKAALPPPAPHRRTLTP